MKQLTNKGLETLCAFFISSQVQVPIDVLHKNYAGIIEPYLGKLNNDCSSFKSEFVCVEVIYSVILDFYTDKHLTFQKLIAFTINSTDTELNLYKQIYSSLVNDAPAANDYIRYTEKLRLILGLNDE